MREKVFTSRGENNNFNPFAKKLIGIAAASAVIFFPTACKSAENGGASVPYNASCLDELDNFQAHKAINHVDIDNSELTGGTNEEYADALNINVLHAVNYPGGYIENLNDQQEAELRQSLGKAVDEVGQHGDYIEIVTYPRDGKSNLYDGRTELDRSTTYPTEGMRQFQEDPDAAYCVNIEK